MEKKQTRSRIISRKDVVVIIPIMEDKFLLQLRDNKPGIVYPNHWGFFGGSIDAGETPDQAAWRELHEELNIVPAELIKFREDTTPDFHSYAYYCFLDDPFPGIALGEGQDFRLCSSQEIYSGRIYSERLQQNFLVIDHFYFLQTITALQTLLKEM